MMFFALVATGMDLALVLGSGLGICNFFVECISNLMQWRVFSGPGLSIFIFLFSIFLSQALQTVWNEVKPEAGRRPS